MNAIASHRPYSWARAWRDRGHDVEVLTFARHAFDGAMDLQRDLAGMRVYEVEYLPVRRRSPGAAASQGSAARWEVLKTLTRRVRFSLGVFADLRLLTYRPMFRRGLERAAHRRFDFIVATSPPEVTFMVARALSRRTGVPWVADFRDLWFRDMLLYRSRLAAWLAGPFNRRLVSTAKVLVTVSRGLQARLQAYLGREVVVSYNGFFEEPAAAEPPVADGRKRIVYTGRLYPGKRDPEPLFRALKALERTAPELASRLGLHFYGFEDPWLRALVERHGVQRYVTMHGFVPYRESMAAQRSADVLLFLDWADVGAEGVLTGKLFEYLGSRRPVLALGPRTDSEAARILATTGVGVTLTNDAEIMRYLQALASSERAADQPAAAVESFSRSRQANELLDAITRRLGA